MIKELRKELKKFADPKKAKFLERNFKNGKGEYAEGDIFLGISVPVARRIAIKNSNISLKEVSYLLKSKIHEERFIALEILVHKFDKSDSDIEKENIYEFYLSNTAKINNWDLVDTSAEYILGDYLSNKDKSVLYNLAKSSNLWERRIAIISTFHFIKNSKFKDTLKISELLLKDKHDLIHKAVGWMLREVGKRDKNVLEDFLSKYYNQMPRTMLRYAIEKFPENIRKQYLKGEI